MLTAKSGRKFFLGLPGPLATLGTLPAGRPSFRGLPTGRLTLGGAAGSISNDFFVEPFGRPGPRLAGIGDAS